MEKIAVVTVTRQGIALGRKIIQSYPDGRLYFSTKYGQPEGEREAGFDGNMKNLLAEIYPRYDGFVFIMALGIVVRSIVDYVKDKKYDPAVVVMDIKGKFAISVLSGHLGGANALTARIAEITGGIPVVTTGTDVNETIAPDLIAKEIGAEIEDFEKMKLVAAALVDGQRVGVLNLSGIPVKSLSGTLKQNVVLCETLADLNRASCKAAIVIDHRIYPSVAVSVPETLFLRPKALAVGVGCNSGTAAEEFEAIFSLLEEEGLSPLSVKTLASIDLKKNEAGLLAFAQKHRLPIAFFTREEIDTVSAPNPSETVEKFIGVKGVAEPAAILVSGGGSLLVEKIKHGNFTMAVARVERELKVI
ncbi:MAG TPA: cobalt-precorrin 5A hydrolase [Nitrospiria bacterium]|nr:cobalt-precorrin 5A hydrolase [Nitrospiria bacterium]